MPAITSKKKAYNIQHALAIKTKHEIVDGIPSILAIR